MRSQVWVSDDQPTHTPALILTTSASGLTQSCRLPAQLSRNSIGGNSDYCDRHAKLVLGAAEFASPISHLMGFFHIDARAVLSAAVLKIVRHDKPPN
jgi:hypothetical protein